LEAKETARGWEASVIMILLLLLMWGEITVKGGVEIRKAFQGLLANRARLKGLCGAEGVGLCAVGCRAAGGKARLVPSPQETRRVIFLEFRR